MATIKTKKITVRKLPNTTKSKKLVLSSVSSSSKTTPSPSIRTSTPSKPKQQKPKQQKPSNHQIIPTREIALRQLEKLKTFGMPERLAADGWDAEWKTLIAILMSARTRDDVTIVVGEKLFSKFPTLESIANASEIELYEVTKSINFFRNKTRNILLCARGIIELFKGKLPHDADELVKLAGVGRKTANVFLAQYGHPAIGVDTHVIQVANALFWTNSQDPMRIEEDLCKLFPKEKWNEVNNACVHFGRSNQSPKRKQEIYDILNSLA
jgi:endonuclease III